MIIPGYDSTRTHPTTSRIRENNTYYKLDPAQPTDRPIQIAYPDRPDLLLEWSFDILPYWGLWVSEGGAAKLEHIAPEPQSARASQLAEAYNANEATRLEPGETVEWSIRLRILRPEPTSDSPASTPSAWFR